MENILVRDVMTRDPVVIGPGENLFNCIKKMVRKRVGSLLIVDNKKLVGFISQRDILWALTKNPKTDLSKIMAVDLSPKKIATIKPTATIRDVINKMNKLRFDRFPVIDGKNFMGIITAKDILNFNPEIYPEIEELSQIREEQEKLKRIQQAKESEFIRDGICEECGDRGALYRMNGMLVCESCKNSD